MIPIKDVLTLFFWFCGGIVTVSAFIGVIVKWVTAAKKPSTDLKNRISLLEEAFLKSQRENSQKFADYDKYFSNDKQRLDDIEKGNREFQKITIKTLQALTDHAINGDHTENLIAVSNAINEYLTNSL